LRSCQSAVDDEDDEDDDDEREAGHSGLSKAKRLFDNLGYTFEKDANPRHPDTPPVRSAGVYYR
jgi:hypothetical protein